MKIDDFTIGQLKEINKLLGSQVEDFNPFVIGQAYLIRTVTHIDIGIVKAVGQQELVLSDASWIADTGRFHNALKEGVKILNEVEPYTQDVIIGRGSIVDATRWTHVLPGDQK